jgi:hypothetical protein
VELVEAPLGDATILDVELLLKRMVAGYCGHAEPAFRGEIVGLSTETPAQRTGLLLLSKTLLRRN